VQTRRALNASCTHHARTRRGQVRCPQPSAARATLASSERAIRVCRSGYVDLTATVELARAARSSRHQAHVLIETGVRRRPRQARQPGPGGDRKVHTGPASGHASNRRQSTGPHDGRLNLQSCHAHPETHGIYDLIRPVEREVVIYKGARTSAFFGTNLASMLNHHSVDTAIVTARARYRIRRL
jgi:hypothetical protein